MTEYVIVGDTDKFDGCLITICGRSIEKAEKILKDMTDYPTEEDMFNAIGHRNLRIKEVEPEKQWWHDPFLAN